MYFYGDCDFIVSTKLTVVFYVEVELTQLQQLLNYMNNIKLHLRWNIFGPFSILRKQKIYQQVLGKMSNKKIHFSYYFFFFITNVYHNFISINIIYLLIFGMKNKNSLNLTARVIIYNFVELEQFVKFLNDFFKCRFRCSLIDSQVPNRRRGSTAFIEKVRSNYNQVLFRHKLFQRFSYHEQTASHNTFHFSRVLQAIL